MYLGKVGTQSRKQGARLGSTVHSCNCNHVPLLITSCKEVSTMILVMTHGHMVAHLPPIHTDIRCIRIVRHITDIIGFATSQITHNRLHKGQGPS